MTEYFVHETTCIDQPCTIETGWMSRHGILLPKPGSDGIMTCPESGWRYKQIEPEVIRCLDWDEEKPLPAEKATGTRCYDEFKT